MPRMKAFLTIIFLSILPFILSCHHTVEPPNDCTPPLPTETTSHNFIWRLDTLGAGNGSVLNDVAIINDTLAYAVGEVYLKDSLGNFDANAYNLLKWDGNIWKLMRIPFIGPCSAVLYPPLRAIWAFSENNILVTNGGSIVRYDGTNAVMDCGMNSLLTGAMNKIWGSNPQDVYGVGNTGSIVHYSNSSWTKLNSGTTIDIQDIWGGINCRGETEILAVASYGTQVPQAKKLLRINGTTVSEVSSAGLPLALSSVWFVPQQKYYAGGDLLYFTNAIGNSWQQEANQPLYYVSRIRGTALNDIVVCGGFGHLSHFNGATWKHYMGTELPRLDGNYLSAALRGNTLVAVGEILGGKAVVTIGRR